MASIEVKSVLSVDLFNRMSGFGAIVVLDTRSVDEFQAGHVPRSINVPITKEIMTEKKDLKFIAKKLGRTDQRGFRMRQRGRIIICSHAAKTEGTYSEESTYLSGLLIEEKKIRTCEILQGGFEAFAAKYPFLSCSYTTKEMSSKISRHTHTPPFPWYPNEIIENFLFLGNHVDASNIKHLKLLEVQHILNVSNDVENKFPNDFQYKRIELPDEETEDITQHFDSAFAFIDGVSSKNERILVHCHQGVSRSATVVMAYIMKSQKKTLKETLDFVRSRRKQVMPNIGFWKQLSAFEKTLFDGNTTVDKCVDLALLQSELDARKRTNLQIAERKKKEKEEREAEEKKKQFQTMVIMKSDTGKSEIANSGKTNQIKLDDKETNDANQKQTTHDISQESEMVDASVAKDDKKAGVSFSPNIEEKIPEIQEDGGDKGGEDEQVKDCGNEKESASKDEKKIKVSVPNLEEKMPEVQEDGGDKGDGDEQVKNNENDKISASKDGKEEEVSTPKLEEKVPDVQEDGGNKGDGDEQVKNCENEKVSTSKDEKEAEVPAPKSEEKMPEVQDDGNKGNEDEQVKNCGNKKDNGDKDGEQQGGDEQIKGGDK